MPLIRQSIPALYGGVSQQAAVLRSASQCEEAINCYFSIAEGVSKRPPLEVVGSLTASSITVTPFYAWVSASPTQRYLLEIPGDGSFVMYDVATGSKITSTSDTGQAYLMSTSPRDDFRVWAFEGTIYIVNRSITTKALTTTSTDTLAGTAQTLQDTALNSAADGSVYKILGSTQVAFEPYYAKKVGQSWVEWLQPGSQYRLDAATMPHQITFNAGIAKFDVVTWADRLVGDTKSNQFPSFIGYPIDGIFFAHDRLGFLCGAHVCMSETSKYTNFFRTTVTDILDTDRIDVAVASDSRTQLVWAKPLHKSVILFSAGGVQFSMDAAPIFSPRSLNLTQATAYPVSAKCEPVSAGPNIYFAANAGLYSQVREMYVEDVSVRTDATDVSSHVHRYVPNNADLMVANNNFDFLAVHSPSTKDQLYAYQYHWSAQQKVQSAWGTWKLSGNVEVISMTAIDHYVYLIYKFTGMNGTQRFIGRINLKLGDPGPALGFTHAIHLDQLWTQSGTYSSTQNKTFFTFPFPLGDPIVMNNVVFVKGSGFSDQGTILVPGGPVGMTMGNFGYQIALDGDLSSGTMHVGLKYRQAFTFSEQFYQASERSGLNVRLQIRNMSVSFVNTGYFNVEVGQRGHDNAVTPVVPGLMDTYTARTVGDAWFYLNRPQLTTAVWRAPILSRSSDAIITLTNDGYTPANFQTAEWEGLVTTRTRG